jgi:hypothetical protein
LEFNTRIGRNSDEAKILLCKIDIILKIKFEKEINLELSENEMIIMNNSLNEIVNWFSIDDFEKCIGDTEKMLIKLHKKYTMQLWLCKS